jgi:hypothetical protein
LSFSVDLEQNGALQEATILMLVLKLSPKKVRAPLALGAVAVAVALVASPALAVSVYTWTTDEGTLAFTDDAKRIPAKYKDAAQSRTIGSLKTYPRLTESQIKYPKGYAERMQARLAATRAPAPPAVSAAPPELAAQPVTIDVSTSGRIGDQVSIPVGDGWEPIVTTSHRVRMRDSIATRHVQVTTQGDRVLAVRVDDRNERSTRDDRLDPNVEAALPVATR